MATDSSISSVDTADFIANADESPQPFPQWKDAVQLASLEAIVADKYDLHHRMMEIGRNQLAQGITRIPARGLRVTCRQCRTESRAHTIEHVEACVKAHDGHWAFAKSPSSHNPFTISYERVDQRTGEVKLVTVEATVYGLWVDPYTVRQTQQVDVIPQGAGLASEIVLPHPGGKAPAPVAAEAAEVEFPF
jgi:hypothetical protein